MTIASRSSFLAIGSLLGTAFVVIACGSEKATDTFASGTDPNAPAPAAEAGSFGNAPQRPDAGDPYANDPPPKWCGPAGQASPPKPGGTEACPDDKNKPGCACDKLGEQKPCWTGLRASRGLGICKDGVTSCKQISETERGWGACEGEVLPVSGATGKSACQCFSAGEWKIANLSPCFVTYGGAGSTGGTYALSSTIDGAGNIECKSSGTTPPPAAPTERWSPSSLKVDCAGHFKLCYELKAGDSNKPGPGDCSLAKVCVEADYLKENVEQPFPDLKGWSSPDKACAEKFNTTGGYGEMSVVGVSVRCDKVDDGAGNARVFSRVAYCPAHCENGSTAPDCVNCQAGGGGSF